MGPTPKHRLPRYLGDRGAVGSQPWLDRPPRSTWRFRKEGRRQFCRRPYLILFRSCPGTGSGTSRNPGRNCSKFSQGGANPRVATRGWQPGGAAREWRPGDGDRGMAARGWAVLSARLIFTGCVHRGVTNRQMAQKWPKLPAMTKRCHSSWKPKRPGARRGHLRP